MAKVNTWIDTDIACGIEESSDVDDCLALIYLFNEEKINIVGFSSVFGNASQADTHKSLQNILLKSKYSQMNPYRGAQSRLTMYGDPKQTPASIAISNYFSKHKGDFISLGPITNLASAIFNNKEIIKNINRVLFVGGKIHEGRRFKVGEESSYITFRDFNYAKDKYSFEIIYNSNLNLHLAGFDLASGYLINETYIQNNFGKFAPFLIDKSVKWIEYWRENFQLDGFYPFDYIAAKSFLHPDKYHCESKNLEILRMNFLFWNIPKSLLVGKNGKPITFCY